MAGGKHRTIRSNFIERLESRTHLDAAPGDVLTSVNNPATGHTYHLLERTTWDDAEAKSIALGGHLVVVNDAAEQEFLWSTFGPLTGIFWIGINDTSREGHFVWSTREPVRFTNWYTGEPNNLYPTGEQWGNMWGNYAGQWNDLGPESPQGKFQYAVAEVRNGPDLFATLAETPTAFQPGDVLNLTGDITNLGSATASGAMRVSYFLSSDTSLDAGDRAIGSELMSGFNLPFNASVSISASLGIPEDVAAGTYRLLAKIDSDNVLAEPDEANNVVVTDAFDIGSVQTPVVRTVRGFVRDADDLPLNGASVEIGDQLVYTDYDGRKKKLDRDGVTGDFELVDVLLGYNVTLGANFVRFVPASATESKVRVVSGDLSGATYAKESGVADLLTLDPTQPDGGLAANTTPTLRTLFLIDSAAGPADGTLRLHRDLRDDRNSHRISTKPNKAIAAAARYRKSVEVLTARLSSLGFQQSPGVALTSAPELKKNAPAERAVKLFKELQGLAPAGKAKVDSKFDEASLASLNSLLPVATPLWTNVLPPDWSLAPDVVDGYVSQTTYEKMRLLAESAPGTQLTLTRASAALGSAGKTFRTGDKIEFRWVYNTNVLQLTQSFWEPIEGFTPRDITLLGGKKRAVPDPSQLNARWRYVAGYNQGATRSVIESLLASGATRVQFNDPLILKDLGAISIAEIPRPKMNILRDDLQPGAGNDAVIFASF